MNKKDDTVTKIIMIIVLTIGIIVLIYFALLLKGYGASCMSNPAKTFYNSLKDSNKDSILSCDCRLSKNDAWVIVGLNESGLFLKDYSKENKPIIDYNNINWSKN